MLVSALISFGVTDTAMQVQEMLAQFDRECRARPMVRAGLRLERIGGVACLTGMFNFVMHWDFSADAAPHAVDAVVEHFRSTGQALMWRIYAHDEPACLPELLARAGFVANPSGTLMLADAQLDVAVPEPAGLQILRVADSTMLDDFLRAANQAFGTADAPTERAAYADDLRNPRHLLYVAYLDEVAVASARIELGSVFGQLFGGGVAPAYRGKGIYRALLAARMQAAREHDVQYVSTEAADSSRPILAGLGFTPAGRETTWVLPHR